MNTDQEKRCEQDEEVRQLNILCISAAVNSRINQTPEEFSRSLAEAIQNAIERWAQRREA